MISLFATFYVARMLGTEKFGALSLFLGLSLIISTISNLGFDNLLIREVALQVNASRELLKKCLVLKLFAVIVGLILSLLMSVFVQPTEMEISLIIPFVIATMFMSFQVFEFYFLAVSKSFYSVWSYSIGGVLSNLLKIIGLFFGMDVVFVAYMVLLEYLISGLLQYYFFRKSSVVDSSTLEEGTISKMMRSAVPLVLSSVSIMIFMKIDQLMIRGFLSLNDLGQYSAAVRISEVVHFVPLIVTGSYFSTWVKQSKEGDDYLRSVGKVLRLLVGFVFVYVIGIWFLGDFFVKLVYGGDYVDTFKILKIHSWSLFFVSFGVVASKILVIKNLERNIFYIAVLGAVINIVFNLLLIPRMGGQGAAVATVISYFFSGYLLYYFSEKTRPVVIALCKSIFSSGIKRA